MDRTLNLPDIAIALGVATDKLPTPEQLAELLAEAEVAAVMRIFLIDDKMLATAWYLHGIASASAAAQLYEPARRTRAFAISAHIFDLALADPRQDRSTILSMAFAAQIGFRRSNSDPNATAIYNRVKNLLEASAPVQGHAATLAIEAGVQLLSLQYSETRQRYQDWNAQLNKLAISVGMGENLQASREIGPLFGTMFGPAGQVLLAVQGMLRYLATGREEILGQVRTTLLSVLNGSAGTGDLNARWAAGHLLNISDELRSGSIWSLLPPGTPPAVAQAFVFANPTVLTLWPPQRELLTEHSVNPLDPSTRQLLLSVPTSAGKTLMAQLIICAHISTQPGSVCFISPLRSLGREMRRTLRERLRVLACELGQDLPDFSISAAMESDEVAGQEQAGTVEIMTPERLDMLLRKDPLGTLAKFSLFVVDEVHSLAQQGRGFRLESLLTTILSAPESPRLVLLSAALGNADKLATWINPNEPAQTLFKSDWRGPRRLHALLTTRADFNRKRVEQRRSTDWPIREIAPLRGRIQLRPTSTGSIHPLETVDDVGELALKVSADGRTRQKESNLSTPNYKTFAAAVEPLIASGSMLMVTSTRDTAKKSALALADNLPIRPQARPLLDQVRARLGAEHPLSTTIAHGVAYHHAGLPLDILDAIEEGLRRDQICAVVGTSTLSEGVNLPVRTVVIAINDHVDVEAETAAARLVNAVGRAGRAGKETEGWIVLALAKEPESADFDRLDPPETEMEVHSTLTSADALASLAEAEELITETADSLFQLADTPAADFVSWVWFRLSMLERLNQLPESDNLEEAVGKLLAFTQIDDDLKLRWLALAETVFSTYSNATTEERMRWTASGTSLGTARVIDRIAGEVARRISAKVEAELHAGSPYALLRGVGLREFLEILGEINALNDLLALPEAKNSWQFQAGRTLVEVPLESALAEWLNCAELPMLATQLLPNMENSLRLEQTVDAVSGTFEHFLPWVIGAIIEAANAIAPSQMLFCKIDPEIPWYIRYGVDTPAALELMNSGMRSRRLAATIGRRAHDAGVDTANLRTWLAEMHLTGWRDEFDASASEILDLLEYVRTRGQSVLRSLLENGTAEIPMTPSAEGSYNPAFDVVDVRLKLADQSSPAELLVIDEDNLTRGRIGASWQSDITNLRDAGLDIKYVLDGETITLTLAEN